jgi:hypothetical protein
MSNRFLDKARQNFVSGDLDWDANTFCFMPIKCDGSLTDTAAKAITAITTATPPVVTCTAHGYTNGDIIVIPKPVGATGMLNAYGTFKIGGVTTNTFTLLTLDGQNVVGTGTFAGTACAINLTAPTFYSDLDGLLCTGAPAFASAAALTSKTNTNGTIGAANVTGITLNDTVHAMLLVQNVTNTPASSRVVHFCDGRTKVTVVADAATSATTVFVEPLEGPLASGTVIQMTNGVTVTLSGAAILGARSISVNALSAGIVAGHHGDAQTTSSGLPISASSGTFNHDISAGIGTI